MAEFCPSWLNILAQDLDSDKNPDKDPSCSHHFALTASPSSPKDTMRPAGTRVGGSAVRISVCSCEGEADPGAVKARADAGDKAVAIGTETIVRSFKERTNLYQRRLAGVWP